ncbi:hypothetical protein [Mycobacterium genavense]|uniref:Rv1893 family protein n=1 Tax=Mycobacterium genavense TaxID=36812 RepID=UPI000472FC25|nr:hypothetical protein [Mycobacterium genavense]
MAVNPRDAVDAVKDIATNAGDIIRGDLKGGVSGIVENSIDIATHAVERTREVFTGGGKYDVAED